MQKLQQKINYEEIDSNNVININKTKDHSIYLSYLEFSNIDNFIEVLKPLKSGYRYSILAKLSHLSDYNISNSNISMHNDWKMLGEQIHFTYNSIDEFENITLKLHNTIEDRIAIIEENYRISNSNIMGIQLLFYQVTFTESVPKKKLFTINQLDEHNKLYDIKKTKNIVNNILPMTTNLNNLGIKLDKKYYNNNVFINLNNKLVSIIDLIKNNNSINNINIKEYDFYLSINHKYIYFIKDNMNNKTIYRNISIYSVSGMKIYDVSDEIDVNDLSNFKRIIGNVCLYINNEGIQGRSINITYRPVYSQKIYNPGETYAPNTKIGTMDLETYVDGDKSFVYAAGFHANNQTKTFYIDKDLNSDKVVMDCFYDMLSSSSYNGYTFYIHNLGRFDSYFLLGTLSRVCSLDKTLEYIIHFKDKIILYIELIRTTEHYVMKDLRENGKLVRDENGKKIRVKTNKMYKRKYTIKIVDSLNILQNKLSNLCSTFNPTVTKGYFPYKFVNKKTLFYEGNKPDISYYNDVIIYNNDNKKEDNNIPVDVYNLISNKWNTKEETIKYLVKDLVSLYEIIRTFSNLIFKNYLVQVTKSLTISGLAMEIFLTRYYNNNIPLITQKHIFWNIKNSYYGGITEVYKPYGTDLYYYDVNSLYPYSALNPMPGLSCQYYDNINKNINECNNIFGFYYCKVEVNEGYIGLLPYRENGMITMPIGTFYGWYFSEELLFANQNGYNITILSGYKFNKEYNVFDKYIQEFYKMKSTTTDPVIKAMSKSLLNNLLGRFGLGLDKDTTEIVSYEKYRELLQHKIIKDTVYIGDNIMVTYSNEVSPDICEDHMVDYVTVHNNQIKQLLDKKIQPEKSFRNISIALSSAVTSYSRIFMNKIKLDILNKGGSIYYTDTDSIVTDIKLDDKIVNSELGNFKLEYELDEAYFISNKTYLLKTKEGKILVKNKGLPSNVLGIEEFKLLYNGIDIKTSKYQSIRNIEQGYVTIQNVVPLTLSANSYTKRTKIFANNKWVDTKPICIKKREYHTYNKTIYVPINYKSIMNFIFISCINILILLILIYYIDLYYNIDDTVIQPFNNICINNYYNNTQNIFQKYLLYYFENKQVLINIVHDTPKKIFNDTKYSMLEAISELNILRDILLSEIDKRDIIISQHMMWEMDVKNCLWDHQYNVKQIRDETTEFLTKIAENLSKSVEERLNSPTFNRISSPLTTSKNTPLNSRFTTPTL